MPTTEMSGRDFTMNDVVQLLGVTRSWILTREKSGILPDPRRTPGGHRTYSTEDLHAIRKLAIQSGLKIPEVGPAKQRAVDLIQGRIAVINQKGGVGKTTIAQNLGFALGNRGFRCLLIDADRQANLTQACAFCIEDEERGLGYALLAATQGQDAFPIIQESIFRTSNPHVDLLPTNNSYMLDAEGQLRTERHFVTAPHFFRKLLKPVATEYDFILVDCPPDLGTLTVNALMLCEGVIIPVDHDLSIRGISSFGTRFSRWKKLTRESSRSSASSSTSSTLVR
jgi:chromosome partitioning protein